MNIECDVWSQDCPPGEKCTAWASGGVGWNGTKCVPADGDGQPGDPCTVEGPATGGVDDCAVGVMCWNVDKDTLQGICVPLCTGSEVEPLCGDGTACAIANDGVLNLCLPTCDPLQTDCAPNEICAPTATTNAFVCFTDASGDEGAQGDPCAAVNTCDPGLFCANANALPACAGGIGCCTEYCDATVPNPDAQCQDQAQGVACVPWWDAGMAPAGLEHVGVCVLPP